jgi:serine/threonine-protein kinase
MADEARLQRVLDEILDSGRSPEEVCSTCPELLPDVRHRLRQMRLVEAELDALFPTPTPDANATPLVPPIQGGNGSSRVDAGNRG